MSSESLISTDQRKELQSKGYSSRAVVYVESLKEESEQRGILAQYVQCNMVEGTDYGVIPGNKSRTLLKPGAEKLVELFRCRAEYTQTRVIEDWDKPLFHYEFLCTIHLLSTNAIVAQGVGSANSREAKYRWRSEERKCPNCGKATIIKGKAEYGGGWLCFGKKGGCGAKFQEGDTSIESQAVGRVENPDVFDCVNTILKVAKKRALVDASISLARCSDLFTQDMDDDVRNEPAQQTRQQQQSQPQPQQQSARPSDEELNELFDKLMSAPDSATSPHQLTQIWNHFAAQHSSKFPKAKWDEVRVRFKARNDDLSTKSPSPAPDAFTAILATATTIEALGLAVKQLTPPTNGEELGLRVRDLTIRAEALSGEVITADVEESIQNAAQLGEAWKYGQLSRPQVAVAWTSVCNYLLGMKGPKS